MKYIISIIIIFFSFSCSSTKKLNVEVLKKKYKLYGLNNNPYFYFMTDSVGGPYLVKTHFMNSSKIIWIEKLERK